MHRQALWHNCEDALHDWVAITVVLMTFHSATIACACTCILNYGRMGSNSTTAATRVKRPLITITTLLNLIFYVDGLFIVVLSPAVSTTSSVTAASTMSYTSAVTATAATPTSAVTASAAIIITATITTRIATILCVALRCVPGPVPDLQADAALMN